jgi:hypothetical protein
MSMQELAQESKVCANCASYSICTSAIVSFGCWRVEPSHMLPRLQLEAFGSRSLPTSCRVSACRYSARYEEVVQRRPATGLRILSTHPNYMIETDDEDPRHAQAQGSAGFTAVGYTLRLTQSLHRHLAKLLSNI